MSGTKVTAFSANGQIRLRPEVLAKLREEMRRIAINGTAQGRRYAHGLFRKYPELRNV